ncbi:MAG: hypothetical protein GF332_03250 [Candidatus Moranbacteria bacterium]|nr:hypothetical protein [Candidatus Moranbacteria bacterium]
MLNQRRKKILEYVISEYTKTAEPISSKYLIEKYDFNISPATMRNELAFLEKKGLLYQPHTSSGRIPTDKAYRFFVQSIMRNRELPLKEQLAIQTELYKLKAQHKRLAKTAAKLLAAFSRNLAISGIIEDEQYFQSGIKELLSQPEFKNADEICQTIEVLDYLDDNIENLSKGLKHGEIKTLIGEENPLVKNQGCSLVVSRLKLPQGQNGVVAILGPKRMQYAKNISLISYLSKIFKNKTLSLMFVTITSNYLFIHVSH